VAFQRQRAFAQEGESKFSIEDFPAARHSVINFGTRHLFGVLSPNLRDLERGLVEALYTFEPRIMRNTLKVSVQIQGNMVELEVEGELWANPLPEHLHIKTKLDMESGFLAVGD